MAFTRFVNETEAQGGVACRQVSLHTESSSSRAVLLFVTVPRGLLHRTFHGEASGGRRAVGWSRAEAGRPFSASSPLLSPQVHLAEAVLWEESGRVAGIFAQCQSQQFPGSLCNIGGDSPDSGTSNRYKASPV